MLIVLPQTQQKKYPSRMNRLVLIGNGFVEIDKLSNCQLYQMTIDDNAFRLKAKEIK